MNNDPTFDSDFLQRLLASAFAVQECGVKPALLTAIIDLQRSIRAGDLDTEQAMRLVAEWARGVGNASGVAMGRLKGDELIYAAGSGSAASYVGRRVMATFSRSARSEAQAEILRVENTEADTSIESAICRQFGVKSLLILPIYFERSVAGVMQVHFHEAHSFDEQEIRIYRVLAGLVGEAMSHKAVAEIIVHDCPSLSVSVLPTIEAPICHLPAPLRASDEVTPASCQTTVSLTSQVSPYPMIQAVRSSTRSFDFHPSQSFPPYKRARVSALVAASIILAFTWMLYAIRPTTTKSANGQQALKPAQQSSAPLTSATASPATTALPAVATPAQDDDQQIRFKPTKHPQASDASYRIKHFGNDVTVRYFDSSPTALRPASRSQVRRISEDVTVRYFQSKDSPANGGSPEVPALVR